MDPPNMAKLVELADAGSGVALRRLALAKAAAEAKAAAAATPVPPIAVAAGEAATPTEPGAAATPTAAGAAAVEGHTQGADGGAAQIAADAGGAPAGVDGETAGPAAGAVGTIDREALPKGEAPPAPGSAAGADTAGAGAADVTCAAAGAADDAPSAEPPWWHHQGVVAAVAAAASAAGTAAALSEYPEDQLMAINLILDRPKDSGESRSPEEVAAQEAETQRQLDLEADARRAEALRRQEQAAADAARAQEVAAAKANQAEAWRLYRTEAGIAWADVPMGSTFACEDIEAHGWDSFPHLQEAKAAFDRRMLNKRPLAEPTASPQAGADAPEEDPVVSGETVASPDVVLIVTEPVSPAGAELPLETQPVKTSPAQPLAAKPQPVPAFTAPAPPKMPGSSTDADFVPSKPMPKPKLHKVQPRGYTDVATLRVQCRGTMRRRWQWSRPRAWRRPSGRLAWRQPMPRQGTSRSLRMRWMPTSWANRAWPGSARCPTLGRSQQRILPLDISKGPCQEELDV